MQSYHQTVLLNEVLEWLQIRQGEWYLDGTLGDGGHALGILKRGGRVVGLDLDPEAIKRTTKRFQAEGIELENYQLIEGNFKDCDTLVDHPDIFAGACLDLGTSMLQFKSPKRGFSLNLSGPLDMRMSPQLQVSAVDLVNALNVGELEALFLRFGEESWGRKIAREIIRVRPLQTTLELAQLVERVVRPRGKIHPATKVFQALRIAVNDELNSLQQGLPQILARIRTDGKLAVISFQGLEDRIVKNNFREWQRLGLGRILTTKPIEPSVEEVKINVSSRSAKLRVFVKA